jgi:hypothetical protein
MAKKGKRQEMSGLFDFFKKKKESEERSLFDPSSPSQLPALPGGNLPAVPREAQRSIFSILAPKSQLPAKIEPKKKTLSPFSIFKSKAVPPQEKPALPVPSRPFAAMFPKAKEEKEESIRELFKGVIKKSPAPTSNRYIFIAPSRPPELLPVRPHGLPAPSTSPVMEWSLPTAEQLAGHFQKTMKLPGIWDMIRDARAHPAFRADQIAYYEQGIPMMIPIDPIVFQETYTDFANFYGIPWNVITMFLDVPAQYQKDAEEALWKSVLSPLNAMLPDAFEMLKPDDLPGFFNASFKEPKGEYWLNYVEPLSGGGPGGT